MSEMMTHGMKGTLLIELFDESGNKIHEERKKNMIVNQGHELVGLIMGNPAEKMIVEYTFKQAATAADYTVTLDMAQAKDRRKEETIDETGPPISQISLQVNDGERLKDVKGVTFKTRNGVEEAKTMYTDYVVNSLDQKKITFTIPIDSSSIEKVIVDYTVEVNEQTSILPFSETVKVNSKTNAITYIRAATPGANTYSINYETGVIRFNEDVTDIEVTYKCLIPYGINYMAVGKKPAGTGTGTLTFDNRHKIYRTMHIDASGESSEYENARQLIEFPRSVERAPNEQRALSLKASTDPNKLQYKLTPLDGPVISIEKINYTKTNNTAASWSVPQKGFGEIDDEKVKIVDAAKGDIEISNDLYAEMKESTTFYVEFKLNAGQTVQYRATFPKGVPEPQKEKKTEQRTITVNTTAPSTFALADKVLEDTTPKVYRTQDSVKNEISEFVLDEERKKITINTNLTANDLIEFEYEYMNGNVGIHQIAMFTHPNETYHIPLIGANPNPEFADKAKMFNISGIGPIFKDQTTEMVITWSVTF